MKKKLFSVMLILCVILSACAQKSNDIETTPTEIETETEPVSDFYKNVVTETRPSAVMIDNDDDNARPQTGLENAYLIYEIIVEGGSTRFMALFKDYNVEKVGPVRSSRHYFLDYVMENDAIYSHCGWSPKAQRDIPSLGIQNINGIIGTDGRAFWRDNTYNRTSYQTLQKTKDILLRPKVSF